MATGALYRRLEHLALHAWPALEQVVYDGWVVRFADGYTKRANSVTALSPGCLDVGEKIAHCEALYRARGLPTTFRLTPFSEPWDLEAVLDGRGYTVLDPTLVLHRPLAEPPIGRARGDLRLHDVQSWLDRHATMGGTRDTTGRHAAILRGIMSTTMPGTWEVNGEPVSCALAVLEDGFVGIFDLLTHVAHRRRGHGGSLVAALLREAFRRGARGAYLQVVETNFAARAVYDGLGFAPAYGYWYRIAPTSPVGLVGR